ncbi:unnamed protein product [Rotaria magnacalcarata]|uniref:Uncharacterized protein n=1 Tax=Rotaria magnacalcarata TaxID=392030 RepID=A0A817ARG5_9BILA|nr:unnamed protein product [Rotaria magnacalcarata]CAF2264857.1 unnamed protein product [Rotaria magnacalcarata]CAF3781145.1 unnamed protein product [Rotaria magnacalcarata]CAF3862906.1 unnamed protein product [Rotaria magnacalcarata]CAF5168835.1 unnamed protein product [Rotaria magnacalcarata]
MSGLTPSDSNTSETAASIAEAEDMKMFQAAKRNGRRNALGDLSEHLSQVEQGVSASEVDKMAPHFQSMSIKH